MIYDVDPKFFTIEKTLYAFSQLFLCLYALAGKAQQQRESKSKYHLHSGVWRFECIGRFMKVSNRYR